MRTNEILKVMVHRPQYERGFNCPKDIFSIDQFKHHLFGRQGIIGRSDKILPIIPLRIANRLFIYYEGFDI
jgi:hypothetical protein